MVPMEIVLFKNLKYPEAILLLSLCTKVKVTLFVFVNNINLWRFLKTSENKIFIVPYFFFKDIYYRLHDLKLHIYNLIYLIYLCRHVLSEVVLIFVCQEAGGTKVAYAGTDCEGN